MYPCGPAARGPGLSPRAAGWLAAGWLAAAWLAGGRLADWLLAAWLLAGWLAGWLLAGWLLAAGSLAGWLAGWLVDPRILSTRPVYANVLVLGALCIIQTGGSSIHNTQYIIEKYVNRIQHANMQEYKDTKMQKYKDA